MTYVFRELTNGPSWRLIQDGFKRRSQGEAFARDYLRELNYTIVMLEHDNEHDGIDIMTERRGALYQFSIDQEH